MKTDRIDDILKRYFQPDAEPGDLAKQEIEWEPTNEFAVKTEVAPPRRAGSTTKSNTKGCET